MHIPFCVRKCNYCAFLSAPADEETREKYVQALIREIENRCKVDFTSEAQGESEECKAHFTSTAWNEDRGCKAYFTSTDSIYFGGGTPSVLSAEQTGRIVEALRAGFRVASDAELTIEVNPGTLGSTEEEILARFKAYRMMGINRLSMGVQSMNDDVLGFIGRIHSAEDVRRDFRLAREAGFDNISLDLILSLPIDRRDRTPGRPDSKERSISDLREIIALGPEHISCYSLQLEEGTPFAAMFEAGEIDEVLDEVDRETYHEVCRILREAGYEHYEISNFARVNRDLSNGETAKTGSDLSNDEKGAGKPANFDHPDGEHSPYRSRHNSKYWQMVDYVAFGLGASGFENGVRYKVTDDMERYLAGGDVIEIESDRTAHDAISEAVFTGLRRVGGISYREALASLQENAGAEAFRRYYNDDELWKEAEGFGRTGHLVIDDEGLRLTEAGIDISNKIMALFV